MSFLHEDKSIKLFTVCVLLYGEHTDLAKRCLNSISTSDFVPYVRDFRIGLNNCCDATKDFAFNWAETVAAQGCTTRCLVTDNELKYPTMRRLFRLSRPATYFMWFDDDSVITSADFFEHLDATVRCFFSGISISPTHLPPAVFGEPWVKRRTSKASNWVSKTMPWAEGKILPAKVVFPTGGWWLLHNDVVTSFDWPVPELRHKGGDMLLGTLLACARLWWVRYSPPGLAINADENLVSSKSPRRGRSAGSVEVEVGDDFVGVPLSTLHQERGNYEEKIFFAKT